MLFDSMKPKHAKLLRTSLWKSSTDTFQKKASKFWKTIPRSDLSEWASILHHPNIDSCYCETSLHQGKQNNACTHLIKTPK